MKNCCPLTARPMHNILSLSLCCRTCIAEGRDRRSVWQVCTSCPLRRRRPPSLRLLLPRSRTRCILSGNTSNDRRPTGRSLAEKTRSKRSRRSTIEYQRARRPRSLSRSSSAGFRPPPIRHRPEDRPRSFNTATTSRIRTTPRISMMISPPSRRPRPNLPNDRPSVAKQPAERAKLSRILTRDCGSRATGGWTRSFVTNDGDLYTKKQFHVDASTFLGKFAFACVRACVRVCAFSLASRIFAALCRP